MIYLVLFCEGQSWSGSLITGRTTRCDLIAATSAGADLGAGCRGCAPLPEMTYGFLIQLVFCKENVVYWC